jgi:phospholipid/cholesterol/gamma-HCH transport system substrate-binding protein
MLVVCGYLVATNSLTADFTETGGIEAGTPVQQSDYVIGTVTSVEPHFPPGGLIPHFEVVMRIKEGWTIPSDSTAVIGEAGLLQGNVIKVKPGSSRTALKGGDRIASGATEPDLGTQLAELADRLSQLMRDSVTPLVASVKRQIEALERLLLTDQGAAGGSQQTIAGILDNLRDVSATLKAQMAAIEPKQLAALVVSARSTARNVETITGNLKKRSRRIESAVDDFGELADRLNRLVKKSDPAIERSLAETQTMLQDLSLALVPILNNLDETTQNLLELSQGLRNDPAIVLWGRRLPDNAPGAER